MESCPDRAMQGALSDCPLCLRGGLGTGGSVGRTSRTVEPGRKD